MIVAPSSSFFASGVLRQGLRVLGTGMRRQKAWTALAVFGSALWGGMVVATAAAIGWLTDTQIQPAIERGDLSGGVLWVIAGLLLGVLVLNATGVLIRRIAAGVTSFNLQAGDRRRVTRQYLRLPLEWHHRHPSGQLLSNAHADIEATWMVFMPLPMAIGVLFMLAIAAVQMVLVDWALALVGLLVFPALFVANLVFQRYNAPRITRAQQLRADVAEVAHESFEAAAVVKALGREDTESRRFERVTGDLRDALIRVGRTRGLFDPVIEALPILGTLAVLGVGAARVSSADVGPGDVAQIAYLFSVMAMPVRAIGWVLSEVPRTVVGWNRVDSVIQARGGMAYGEADLPRTGAAHSRSEGVTYTYHDRVEHEQLGVAAAVLGGESVDEPAEAAARDAYCGSDTDDDPRLSAPALHDVTLDVPAGATIALVGPTGSGKSTLANVVLRLIDPDGGVVSIDGVDLRDVRHGGISDVAVLVSQQTFMFDESVRGNVTLGADVPEEEVDQALQVAQAAGFVAALPDGADTVIGERGGSLSGGQRQRIALARALVRRPRLLVLDDATSAVDPSVEQAILTGIRESSSGSSVLVVAYRMATIRLADRIVYLERGRIRGVGSHEELMTSSRGYRDLVTAYAREAAERALLGAEDAPAPQDPGAGAGSNGTAPTTGGPR